MAIEYKTDEIELLEMVCDKLARYKQEQQFSRVYRHMPHRQIGEDGGCAYLSVDREKYEDETIARKEAQHG